MNKTIKPSVVSNSDLNYYDYLSMYSRYVRECGALSDSHTAIATTDLKEFFVVEKKKLLDAVERSTATDASGMLGFMECDAMEADDFVFASFTTSHVRHFSTHISSGFSLLHDTYCQQITPLLSLLGYIDSTIRQHHPLNTSDDSKLVSVNIGRNSLSIDIACDIFSDIDDIESRLENFYEFDGTGSDDIEMKNHAGKNFMHWVSESAGNEEIVRREINTDALLFKSLYYFVAHGQYVIDQNSRRATAHDTTHCINILGVADSPTCIFQRISNGYNTTYALYIDEGTKMAFKILKNSRTTRTDSVKMTMPFTYGIDEQNTDSLYAFSGALKSSLTLYSETMAFTGPHKLVEMANNTRMDYELTCIKIANRVSEPYISMRSAGSSKTIKNFAVYDSVQHLSLTHVDVIALIGKYLETVGAPILADHRHIYSNSIELQHQYPSFNHYIQDGVLTYNKNVDALITISDSVSDDFLISLALASLVSFDETYDIYTFVNTFKNSPYSLISTSVMDGRFNTNRIGESLYASMTEYYGFIANIFNKCMECIDGRDVLYFFVTMEYYVNTANYRNIFADYYNTQYNGVLCPSTGKIEKPFGFYSPHYSDRGGYRLYNVDTPSMDVKEMHETCEYMHYEYSLYDFITNYAPMCEEHKSRFSQLLNEVEMTALQTSNFCSPLTVQFFESFLKATVTKVNQLAGMSDVSENDTKDSTFTATLDISNRAMGVMNDGVSSYEPYLSENIMDACIGHGIEFKMTNSLWFAMDLSFATIGPKFSYRPVNKFELFNRTRVSNYASAKILNRLILINDMNDGSSDSEFTITKSNPVLHDVFKYVLSTRNLLKIDDRNKFTEPYHAGRDTQWLLKPTETLHITIINDRKIKGHIESNSLVNTIYYSQLLKLSALNGEANTVFTKNNTVNGFSKIYVKTKSGKVIDINKSNKSASGTFLRKVFKNNATYYLNARDTYEHPSIGMPVHFRYHSDGTDIESCVFLRNHKILVELLPCESVLVVSNQSNNKLDTYLEGHGISIFAKMDEYYDTNDYNRVDDSLSDDTIDSYIDDYILKGDEVLERLMKCTRSFILFVEHKCNASFPKKGSGCLQSITCSDTLLKKLEGINNMDSLDLHLLENIERNLLFMQDSNSDTETLADEAFHNLRIIRKLFEKYDIEYVDSY